MTSMQLLWWYYSHCCYCLAMVVVRREVLAQEVVVVACCSYFVFVVNYEGMEMAMEPAVVVVGQTWTFLSLQSCAVVDLDQMVEVV